MKQSGHLNPSEETGTGCPVTSKYGRIPPNKQGGVGRQQQQQTRDLSYIPRQYETENANVTVTNGNEWNCSVQVVYIVIYVFVFFCYRVCVHYLKSQYPTTIPYMRVGLSCISLFSHIIGQNLDISVVAFP